MAPKNKYNEITKLNNILLLPAFSCDGNHYRTRELIAQVFSIKGNVKPLIFIMGYSNPEKTNYTFINLCDILSLKDYIYIFIKYIRIVVRVMINLRLNRNIILVKINNKNSLLMKYLTKELFIKVAIASAVDKISSCNTICAMRMLLNFNSFAGNQLYKIKEKNSKVVVFRNDSMAKWGYYTEGDYNKFYDYQFVNSNADKLWYKDKVHKDCKIIDTGNEYVSKKIQERKTFDKVMMPHKIKLLYATGGVTPGVYSKEELYYNLRFLLDIDKSRYEVMIKPHPAEDVDFILQTIEGLGGSNELCILPKNKDIGVFFDEIDLFITKLSTSIWKAAAAGLPVITITNTHDYQENYYEGLACNFSSHNELHRHLIVTSDFDVFSEWRLKRIKSQDDFFLSNDILTNHSPIVKVADRLMVDIGCI